MRLFFFLMLFSGVIGSCLLADTEIDAMDQLILLTKGQLAMQRTLRARIWELRQLKEEFLQGQDTPAYAKKMVRIAREILQTIERDHLEQLFSQEYLEELAFFTKIAEKENLKRP